MTNLANFTERTDVFGVKKGHQVCHYLWHCPAHIQRFSQGQALSFFFFFFLTRGNYSSGVLKAYLMKNNTTITRRVKAIYERKSSHLVNFWRVQEEDAKTRRRSSFCGEGCGKISMRFSLPTAQCCLSCLGASEPVLLLYHTYCCRSIYFNSVCVCVCVCVCVLVCVFTLRPCTWLPVGPSSGSRN